MPRGEFGNAEDHEGLVPFRVLDTSDRRVAGVVYLVGAVMGAFMVVTSGVHLMWVTAVVPLLLIALYQFVTGTKMNVSVTKALDVASDAATFEVGHGSATLGFSGVRARPIWQVLVFEAGVSPRHQALITVDALTGEVRETFEEEVSPV